MYVCISVITSKPLSSVIAFSAVAASLKSMCPNPLGLPVSLFYTYIHT